MSDPVQMAEAIAGTLRAQGISKPADIEAAMAIPTLVALNRIADAVEDLVEVVRAMAPVSISVERTVDLGVTDEATGPRP